MTGKPGRSGGHNKKSIHEHLASGTYRKDRHGPLDEPEKPLVDRLLRSADGDRGIVVTWLQWGICRPPDAEIPVILEEFKGEWEPEPEPWPIVRAKQLGILD